MIAHPKTVTSNILLMITHCSSKKIFIVVSDLLTPGQYLENNTGVAEGVWESVDKISRKSVAQSPPIINAAK